ncbi:circularly permutated Ras protein 1-like isoform 1-T3 [Menidia menidia]
MEFACEFVYVLPSLSQRCGPHLIKRSALLPPVNWVRPSNAPPPPPSQSAKAKAQQAPTFSPKVIKQLEKSREVKVQNQTTFYENTEFHKKQEAASPKRGTPPPTLPTGKTALLPPHMRPRAKSLSPSNTSHQIFTYDETIKQPGFNSNPLDPDSHNAPEGSEGEVKLSADAGSVSASAPSHPPRPTFMKLMPEYLEVLPASPSSPQKPPSPSLRASTPTGKGSPDKGPLPGNPNVVLVSLGKLLSEERVQPTQGEPTFCSQCGSVLNTCYDSVVEGCYFCQSSDLTSSPSAPQSPLNAHQHGLFLLNPDERPPNAADALLLFCIDVSGSMSITSQVLEGDNLIQRSRLEFVQEAVLQCVERLSEQHPGTRVGLITFSYQVTMHGHENVPSRSLSGAELTDKGYLNEAADSFPIPPPLSQTKDCLQKQVTGLSANGATALGPAALIAITMASRQPGSKVIICTDGKANAGLGNLEEEDNDAHTLLSSTIFYQELGEYAANQGVTVSVMSIERTDCRLDELGRLADRTGGNVVIASPNRLHAEFDQIIQNRTVATHCSVTLLLPKSLRVRGEREAQHKGIREVGNVNSDTEITFQFGANENDTEMPAPAPGSCVSIQLQIRCRHRDGQTMLRVLTANRRVSNDSSAALSSLSVAIVQLNSAQVSAALAVRGRFQAARREGEQQLKLIERAIEHNHNSEDKKTLQEWVKNMEPIYYNIHNLRRGKSMISHSQSLTDAGAALLFTMKHSNRKSISLKNKQL